MEEISKVWLGQGIYGSSKAVLNHETSVIHNPIIYANSSRLKSSARKLLFPKILKPHHLTFKLKLALIHSI